MSEQAERRTDSTGIALWECGERKREERPADRDQASGAAREGRRRMTCRLGPRGRILAVIWLIGTSAVTPISDPLLGHGASLAQQVPTAGSSQAAQQADRLEREGMALYEQ